MMDLTLETGSHACLLYEDANQQKSVVLPFIQEGLANGEHCLFVTSEDSVDTWSIELQAYGIDVMGELDKGALAIATGEQWRQSSFSSIVKARELWKHMEPRLVDFPAMRIIGDASWAQIHPPVTSAELCHWEATADLLYEGVPVRTICMYDLSRHAASDIQAALRTHPTVVLGRGEYANPHFEASRILENEPYLNDCEADASVLGQLLAVFQA